MGWIINIILTALFRLASRQYLWMHRLSLHCTTAAAVVKPQQSDPSPIEIIVPQSLPAAAAAANSIFMPLIAMGRCSVLLLSGHE